MLGNIISVLVDLFGGVIFQLFGDLIFDRVLDVIFAPLERFARSI